MGTRQRSLRATGVVAIIVLAASVVPVAQVAAREAARAEAGRSGSSHPGAVSALLPSDRLNARGAVSRDATPPITRPTEGGIGAPPGGPISFVQPLESSLLRDALPGDPESGYVWLFGGAVGDLNGDGNADVVVTVDRYINSMNGHVVVMRGNGDGTFEYPAAYALGGPLRRIAHGLALADFDGDEDLDVVVAVPASREIQFFANDGSGLLAAPTFTPTNDRPEEVVAGDLDGDGTLDLVTVNTDDDSISILEGIGDGSFGAPVDHDTGDTPLAAVIADLDGVNGLDIAVGEYIGRRIGLFLSQGGLDYPATGTTLPGLTAGVTRLAAAELDGSPGTDLVATLYNVTGSNGGDCSNCLVTVAGSGDGTFTVPAGAEFTAIDDVVFSGLHGTLAPPTDLEGDGDLDLVVAHLPGDTVTVALNDGTGRWARTSSWSTLTGAPGDLEPKGVSYGPVNGTYRDGRSAWPADFDGDGHLDIAVVADGVFFTDGGVTVLPADPAAPGRYLAPELLFVRANLDNYERTVAITDWNGDGDGDLIAGAGYQYEQILWFEGHGDGTFEEVRTVGLPGLAGLGSACLYNKQLFPGDFDGDGATDLLCRTTTGPGYQSALLYGDGAGGVEQVVALTSGTATHATPMGQAVVADVDGDGDSDFVNPRDNADGVTLFVSLNGGAGRTWSDGPQLPIGHATEVPLAAADVDADGDLDLVARPDYEFARAGYTEDRLVLFANQGGATFGPAVTTTSGVPLRAIEMVAGDLDEDGDDDLVAGVGHNQWNHGDDGGGLYVLLSNGDGTFDQGVQYRTEPYLQLEILDVDGDGHLDVADGNYCFGLEVVRGKGDGTLDLPARFAFGEYRGQSIAFGDVNGDGLPDAATTRTIADSSYETGTVISVLLNTSTGIEPGTPPDLTVESVEAPEAATPGDEATVRFTVRNDGGDAEGTWADQVWLSADDTWDLDDRLLGSVARTDLSGGATYEVEVTLPFHPLLDGDHTVIVRTDARRQLAEDDETDNEATAGPVALDVPDLLLGTTLDVELADYAVRYARVPVGANQKAAVTLDAPVGDVAAVEAVRGRVPVPVRDLVMPEPDATHRTLVLPPGDAAGDWFIRLEGRAAAGGGTTVTLAADELTFGIVDVSPARGSNRGETTVTVTGEGFGDDSAVSIVPEGGGTARTAETVVRPDSATLYATLDLTGLPVGVYDVEVESGGETARAPGAFTVNDAQQGEIRVYFDVPGQVRPIGIGRTVAVVTWRNVGDTDLHAPIFELGGTDLEFDPERDGSWEPGPIELLPAAPGAAPGILPAGAIGRFEVLIAPQAGRFEAGLSIFEADDPTPLDAGAMVEGMRTPELSNAAWAAISADLADVIGTTTGSYVTALDEAAREAAGYGVDLPTSAARYNYLGDRSRLTAGDAPLRGRVRLADPGQPVVPLAGAAVEATGNSGTYAAHTWYDGTFRLWDLPAGDYEIEIPGRRPHSAGEVAVPSAEAAALELTVETGASLRGAVTDETAAPVVDAQVAVIDAAGGAHYDALTDEAGRYEITGLDPGEHLLRVEAVDLVPFETSTDTVGGTPVTLDVVLASGGALAGVVRGPGGSPVAGASVFIAVGDDGFAARGTLTDEEGRYEIRGLEPGTREVSAEADGLGGAAAEAIVVAGTTAEADLELRPEARLEGQVVAAAGGPVAGATVMLQDALGHSAVATVDEAGEFAIGSLPAGEASVTVAADGYALGRATVALTEGDAASLTVTIGLASTVSGQVRRASGEALANAEVMLQGLDEWSATSPPALALTGAEGSYAFDSIPPGEYRVAVSGDLAVGEVDVPGTGSPVTADLVVEAGTLGGRLVVAGEPRADEPVALVVDGDVITSTRTDPSGRFTFAVVGDGPFALAASGEGLGLMWRSAIVPEPGGSTDVGDLEPGSATLTVDVAAGDPAPVSLGAVLTRAGDPLILGGAVDGSTVTFDHLQPGDYELLVSATGRARRTVDVSVAAGGNSLDVTLDPAAPLTGTVFDGSEPVGQTAVWARSATDDVYLALTGADGSFSFPDTGAGSYDVSVAAGGAANARLTGQGVPGPDLAIVAGDGETVVAVVSSAADGDPVAGAYVSVSDESGLPVAAALSGTDGTVSLGPLADGDYEVTVDLAGHRLATTPLSVPPAGTVDLVAGEGLAVPLDPPPEAGPSEPGRAASFGRSRPMTAEAPVAPAIYGEEPTIPERLGINPVEWAKHLGLEFQPAEPERAQFDLDLPTTFATMREFLAARGDRVCPEAYELLDHVARLDRAKENVFQVWQNQYDWYIENAIQIWLRPALRIAKIAGTVTLLLLTFEAWGPAVAAQTTWLTGMGVSVTQIGTVLGYFDAFWSGIGSPLFNSLWNLSPDTIASEFSNMMSLGTLVTVMGGVFGGLAFQIQAILDDPTFGTGKQITEKTGKYKAKRVQRLYADAEAALKARKVLADFAGVFLFAADAVISVNDGMNEVMNLLDDQLGNLDRINTARLLYKKSLDRMRDKIVEFWTAASRDCSDEEKVSTSELLSRLGSYGMPSDPNEIIGPAGFGPSYWLAEEASLGYEIDFENLGPGSLVIPPGQEPATTSPVVVDITTTLDVDADLSTFELGDVGFGDVNLQVPNGLQEWSTRLGPFDEWGGIFVDVAAELDGATRQAHWRLTAIDPETGEPPLDFRGFLPPEDGSGDGRGFASYRVQAKAGLVTGTELSAQARIVFDTNDPIDTNVWVNTVDAGAPFGWAGGLPPTSVSPFTVSWSGFDDFPGPAGSGVGSFDVFVSVDGGPLGLWLSDTAATSSQYAGVVGHTYGFAVRAADNVGHVGAMPDGPHTTTRVVETSPPPTTTTTTTVPSSTPTTRPRGTTTTTSGPDSGGQGSGRRGFVTLAADGGVFTFGGALFRGSLAGTPLNGEPVAILRTPSGQGYYVVTSDGGVFAFGDAVFRGSLGGLRLNAPIVDAALTPSGRGYLLVAADGGVFTFGDAGFVGSMAGEHLNGPVVAVMMAADGGGYWLVAADGGVFSFGDIGFFGSLGAALCPSCSEATREERARQMLAARIVDGAPSPDGDGYWLVGADGGVFAFGGARYRGSLGGLSLNAPIVEIAATGTGGGYRLAGADGGLFAFGDAAYQGTLADTHMSAPVTGLAT